MQRECIISAGIDIGTSTTKLVLSELEIQNTAGFGSAPRIEITNRKIFYRSPIYRTPLINDDVIDMAQIHKLILKEYKCAQLTPSSIQTGAIMITGETATKRNAEEVIHTLSNEVGDFLVATAGADLEGILAAKGSGAFAYSEEHPSAVIANIDIGGGTANIAVVQNQCLLGTCTLHIGGRLLEFEGEIVRKVSPPIQKWCMQKGIDISIGTAKSSVEIQQLLEDMLDALMLALKGEIIETHPLLLGQLPSWAKKVDTLMFSGGVANFLHDTNQKCIGDLGFSIAQVIRESNLHKAFHIVRSAETVAATVIGTCIQTTEVSGATIHVTERELPIKNCPIIVVDLQKKINDVEQHIKQAVQFANTLYQFAEEEIVIAWFIENVPRLSFRDVERTAKAFLSALDGVYASHLPHVFVFQKDYGKVFGQTLLRLNPTLSVISIDQIQIDQGDYIDIGRMIDAGIVPLVVKTLAFHGR